MIATAILPPATPARQFLTTGATARQLGCSINSVRALLDSGELDGYATQGGHHRVSSSSLLTYLYGVAPEEQVEVSTAHKGVVIYARTSNQNQKASLVRQIERLKTEVSEKEGIEDPEIIPIYQDCASAFGNRDSLNRLVDAMLNGEVTRVYAEYYDRVSRVPALSALIEHIARRCGVEIIALDIENTDEDDQQEWVRELVAYITVISNRISSAKAVTLSKERFIAITCPSTSGGVSHNHVIDLYNGVHHLSITHCHKCLSHKT